MGATPGNGAIYISPNQLQLTTAHSSPSTSNYIPIEKGMGFNTALFTSLVQAGIQLTVATVQVVSDIHKTSVQDREQKRLFRREQAAVLEEQAKRDAEAKKYGEMMGKLGEPNVVSPGTTTDVAASLPAVQQAKMIKTVLLAGGLGLGAILLIKVLKK